MFELKKIFNETKYQEEAIEGLKNQFGIVWESWDNDVYRVHWSSDHFKPYVLIINKYENSKMIKKEWYEYYSKKWNYRGYLSRKECLELYWVIRHDSSVAWYGKNIRNDKDNEQVERLVRYNLDEYVTEYYGINLKKHM